MGPEWRPRTRDRSLLLSTNGDQFRLGTRRGSIHWQKTDLRRCFRAEENQQFKNNRIPNALPSQSHVEEIVAGYHHD